jgi:hypothetical protein
MALLFASEASPQSGAAQTPELLHAATDVTYDARLDEGPLAVTWDVSIDNNDPSTTFNNEGVSYFYTSYIVPVLRGASSLSATSSTGASLAVSTVDEGTGPIVAARVQFESGLFYGNSYSFSLSYQVPPVRSESLLITPFYAFFPALGAGNTSTVQLVLPNDPAWDSTVQDVDPDCEGDVESGYACDSGGASLPLPVLVEVSQPNALESVESSVELDELNMALTVRHFPGEDAWADHTLQLAEAALPVLEEITGLPYPEDAALEITERGQLDLLGYEGVFSCPDTPCSIGLSPISNDLTTLHELAHAWTTNIEQRWIAEGLAEFIALRAASRLPELVVAGEVERTMQPAFPLDEWEREILPLDAGEAERDRELVGYARSVRFMEILERRTGTEEFQETLASLASSSLVDSKDYLDALEDTTGRPFGELFLEWVFAPSFKETLDQRSEARTNFAIVRALAAQSGLELTPNIEGMMDNWRFELAQSALDEAGDALAVYDAARRDVEGSRSPLERIGLIGEDPDDALEDAAVAFEVGRYAETRERSADAQETIDDATTTGLIRLLIVIALPVALVAIVLVAIWQRRRATRSGPSPSI